MAQQHSRKAPPSKPITEHPLFPAVVALWFGAVFGLGSLAVRPALFESLVVRSGIDLIVPAAAPPLGITARILVALVLAATGSILGIVVARRLVRPKTEKRERNRTMHSSEASEQPLRHRDAHPDAPARRPISAREELGEELSASPATTSLLAPRRRSLTIADDDSQFVPHESAPLPGGTPQVLDIAAIGTPPVAQTQSPAPLELDVFVANPISEIPPIEQGQAHLGQVTGERAAAWTPSIPEWQNQPAPQDSKQHFDAEIAPDLDRGPASPPFAAPASSQEAFESATYAPAPAETTTPREAAARDGRQVFGMAPVEPQATEDRQIFGVTPPTSSIVDEARIETDVTEPVASTATAGSIFAAPTSTPLFSARPTAHVPAEPATDAAEAVELAASAMPEIAEEPASGEAPRADLTDLSDMGMIDLAARLQESLARRRAARAAPPPAPQSAPATVADPVAQLNTVPSFTVPAVAEPTSPLQFTAPPAMPSALRPLSFDDDFDDDTAELASLLPPRRIAFAPETVAPAEPESAGYNPVNLAASELDGDPTETETGDEAAYASLLKVPTEGQARNPFVRIDEVDAIGDAVQPVVIFPGQASRVTMLGADGSSAGIDPGASFRRFDSPANAESGQPIAMTGGASSVDPDEAERALRAALSSLQRISGAA